MISNKTNSLIYLLVFMMIMTGCRVGSHRESIIQYSFESKLVVFTTDGESYSKLPTRAIFNFSPDRVKYQFQIEDKWLEKEFEIQLTKTSIDHRFYYYTKGINNLFVLDVGRGTLQVFGGDAEGKRRASFSGHTFFGRAKMHLANPNIDHLPKEEISSINYK